MSVSTNLLLAAAVIPGVYLLYYVYKLDSVEREPVGLLLKLFFSGIPAILYAIILELIGSAIISLFFDAEGLLPRFLEYFLVVAVAEESGKYLLLKKFSYKHPAFNYRFDGIVYAVSIGVGFAVFENIMYAFQYGLINTLIRAVTAIPAHTICAIFMGYFYGQAKLCSAYGYEAAEKRNLRLSLLVSILIHGSYDFIASGESLFWGILFLVFIVCLIWFAFRQLKKYAANDRPL